MAKKIRIGALVSGGGTNLQAIIDACEQGSIDGTIVFVGADNPDAGGLERAREHRIPTFVVDYAEVIRTCRKHPETFALPEGFDLEDALAKQSLFTPETPRERKERFLISRAAAEAMLLEKMRPYPFDLLVLAGFMRNISPYLIDRVNTTPGEYRIMNIHPALLPAFPGVDGYGDTFRYGCKVGGCTVHFIDYGEDSGPIIGQRTFPILEEDTLEQVKEKGLKLEWELYPECIQLFAENRLKPVKMTYRLPTGGVWQRTVVKRVQTGGGG